MALPALRLLLLARWGWKRIPPAQRRKMMIRAAKAARTQGPVIAKRIRDARAARNR